MNSTQRLIESQLQDALREVASATVPDSAIPPGLTASTPQRSRHRRYAAVAAVAAAVVAIALSALAIRSQNTDRAPVQPGQHSSPAVSTTHSSASGTKVGGFCDNFVPDGCAHPNFQPLRPDTSYTQASQYRTTATSPSQTWRHSPKAVARRYLAALGYSGIILAGSDAASPHERNVSADSDLIDTSHDIVGGLSLGQYGNGAGAPWEVIGFPRTVPAGRLFALDSPRRTAKVHDAITVRGRRATPGAIVRVRTVSVTTVISTDRVRADPTGHWTATLRTASRGVTTVAADSQGTPAQPRQLIIIGFGHQ